jgi:hypothetical protein
MKPELRRIVAVSITCLPVLFHAGVLMAQEMTQSFTVSRLTTSYSGERGGGGGFPFNLSCTDGQVLVGVNARAGLVVDRLQGLCRPVTAQGAWTGSESGTGSAGGGGGNAVTRRCPQNYAVSGFSGRQGAVLDRVSFECTRLASNDSFDTTQRTMLSAVGGLGGSEFGVTRCSRPGRALSGRAGSYVDAVRVVCERAAPLMTTAQIDAALSSATSLLQNDADGRLSADVACPVTLRRNGRTRIHPSLGMWSIDSLSQLNSAFAIGGAVVVNAINYCDGIGTNIVGCARPSILSPPQMVMVPLLFGSIAQRGTLWAHEFGHTRWLPHRDNNSGNIMFSTISSAGFVNGSECNNFRN